MNFSFIHAADIHLDRPFSGLSKYSYDVNNENLYKEATQKAFNKLIDFALLKNVDFVLFAGDTFDSTEQDFKSKLILKEGLLKLSNAGIKVYLICGNHDPITAFNKNTFNFKEDSNVKIIGLNTPQFGKFKINNKNNEEIALLHALSYSENTFRENPLNYYNKASQEDKKLFNIGLMHIDKDSDKTSPYLPCNTGELKSLDYDYYALGHIHVPDINDEKIRYSGTIQGRNSKEAGEHGIYYVKVENNQIVKNTFVPTDIIRFENININFSNENDITEAYNTIQTSLDEFVTTNNNQCELFLIKLSFEGSILFFEELNEKFYNVLSEKIKIDFNSKIYISEIENNTIPKYDEETLKNDEGISGEIYKTINLPEIELQNTFNSIEKELKNILSNCDFTKEEYEEIKNNVIKNAKEECITICNKIYYNEMKED